MSRDLDLKSQFEAIAAFAGGLMQDPEAIAHDFGESGEWIPVELGNQDARFENVKGEHATVPRPYPPATVYPSNVPTVRATAAAVNGSVDGSFQISFYEMRPTAPVSGDESFDPTKNGLFETGRVALSPFALRILEKRIKDAITLYERVFGHLPTLDEFRDRHGFEIASEQLSKIQTTPTDK